jgi:hypothetical protein
MSTAPHSSQAGTTLKMSLGRTVHDGPNVFCSRTIMKLTACVGGEDGRMSWRSARFMYVNVHTAIKNMSASATMIAIEEEKGAQPAPEF